MEGSSSGAASSVKRTRYDGTPESAPQGGKESKGGKEPKSGKRPQGSKKTPKPKGGETTKTAPAGASRTSGRSNKGKNKTRD